MLANLSARSRILLLVAASILPMIAVSVYVTVKQHDEAELNARKRIELRAELASAVLANADPEDFGERSFVKLGPGEALSVHDANGAPLAVYPRPAAGAAGTVPNPQLLARMLAAGSGAFEGEDQTGEVRLYAITKIAPQRVGNAGPIVVASISTRAVHHDMYRSLVQTLSGAAAVALILVLAGLYAAERHVLRSVRTLLDMTRRVRGGDLGARTALRASHDELSQLGAALDDMAQQLQTRDFKLHQAFAQMREQATTDPLTGLYNRRYFWDALEREVLNARRRKTAFSVILLDIDHFKRINDTWGHDAGDQVLKAIARVIRAHVRGSDIAVRYGGEEFAMLLPDTAAEVAEERAQTLRRALEALQIAYRSATIGVTASFGVAEYKDHGDPGAGLMKRVDDAMYAAKSAGRNRVVVAAARNRAVRRTARSDEVPPEPAASADAGAS